MISVEELKINLKRPYHPDSLHIAVDANDDSQLYIISNGGMANYILYLMAVWPI